MAIRPKPIPLSYGLDFFARLCSSSVHACADPTALNAISPFPTVEVEEERRARHLRMARELAELGMALARAAATQALLEWRAPPGGASEPPAPDSTPADTAAETQAAEPAAVARPRPDHALAFARLSRAVRQTIALEARIAAGDIASPRRHRHPGSLGEHPADRRPFPLEGRLIDQASDADLNRALSLGLLRDIAERLDDDPEIEPEDIAAIADTLRRACNDLGIGLDPRQEPDGWLDAGQPTSLSPNPLSPSAIATNALPSGALPTEGLASRLGPDPGHVGWPRDHTPPPRHAGPRPHPPGRDPPLP